MRYVDGFVLIVPKDKLADYKKMAKDGARIWMKHGALDYKECIGEDLSPDMGEHQVMTFLELAKPKPNEVVVFSYIVFRSRKHRDQVNAKVMKDPSMTGPETKDKAMPFDIKRMAYGGFEVIVDGLQAKHK